MNQEALRNILFIDIETVSNTRTLEELDPRLIKEWKKKAAVFQRTDDRPESDLFRDKAAIYAEFGKIIVIGMGFFAFNDGKAEFRLKALSGNNELELLDQFRKIISRFDPEKLQLCAHNGKDFDFPYISRRMLINGMKLPEVLKLSGKKPWEVQHLDTMEMWKFGDFRHYASLDLIAALFNIETSKSDLDGSMVGTTYYEEGDLNRIVQYCLNDVEVAARIYLCLTEQQDLQFDVVLTDGIN